MGILTLFGSALEPPEQAVFDRVSADLNMANDTHLLGEFEAGKRLSLTEAIALGTRKTQD
jgi:hypothetical protein